MYYRYNLAVNNTKGDTDTEVRRRGAPARRGDQRVWGSHQRQCTPSARGDSYDRTADDGLRDDTPVGSVRCPMVRVRVELRVVAVVVHVVNIVSRMLVLQPTRRRR